jgi:hypothetical protein
MKENIGKPGWLDVDMLFFTARWYWNIAHESGKGISEQING